MEIIENFVSGDIEVVGIDILCQNRLEKSGTFQLSGDGIRVIETTVKAHDRPRKALVINGGNGAISIHSQQGMTLGTDEDSLTDIIVGGVDDALPDSGMALLFQLLRIGIEDRMLQPVTLDDDDGQLVADGLYLSDGAVEVGHIVGGVDPLIDYIPEGKIRPVAEDTLLLYPGAGAVVDNIRDEDITVFCLTNAGGVHETVLLLLAPDGPDELPVVVGDDDILAAVVDDIVAAVLTGADAADSGEFVHGAYRSCVKGQKVIQKQADGEYQQSQQTGYVLYTIDIYGHGITHSWNYLLFVIFYYKAGTVINQMIYPGDCGYISEESHYSNLPLADLQKLEVRLIKGDEWVDMIPEDFEAQLDPERPALVVYSIGTTFKGGIDNQATLNKVLKKVKPVAFYRHIDAALFGGKLAHVVIMQHCDKKLLDEFLKDLAAEMKK